jgi:hypothetical protein
VELAGDGIRKARRPLHGTDSRKSYMEYSWSLKRSTPRELCSRKKQSCWCHRCGRLHFGKCKSKKNFCAMDVARWDTSFITATRPKGIVLVHLEGNDGRTRLSITIRVVKACGFALFCS